MRKTKNVILGIVGVFIAIYTLLICLNIYSIQTHKNKLENTVSRAVENTLESMYRNGNEAKAKEQLEKEIEGGVSEDGTVDITIRQMDLEKGILAVTVTEEFPLITGTTKSISIEKTAIMEQAVAQEDKVTITFMLEDEVYKEYQLTKGEECPIPKPPSDIFTGWIVYGSESLTPVKTIGKVWEDQVYLALMR